MKRYSGPDSPSKASSSSKRGLTSGPGLAVLLAVAVAVALLLGWLTLAQNTTPGGTADVGGPFQLIDQDGRPVNEAILKGRWSAVFFGYVSCPDICPATMQTLAAAQTRLGPDAGRLQVVFISVDPARDTPAELKAWSRQAGFPRPVRALTGSPQNIAAAAKAYRVYFAKENRSADYQVAHSTAIYLMNPNGRFVAPLAYEQGPDKLAHALADAMRGR
jgi:protein SCO1/2